MEIGAEVGDMVSGAFITLADLSVPQLEVFLDETDAANFAIGYKAEVVFDALPDSVFTGQVIQVDPRLNNQGNISTVQGLVQLDPRSIRWVTGWDERCGRYRWRSCGECNLNSC